MKKQALAAPNSRAFGFGIVKGGDGSLVGVRNTENAFAFNTETDVASVRSVVTQIQGRSPGAAVYVGSGGHGRKFGAYFGRTSEMIESEFLEEDIAVMKSMQELGSQGSRSVKSGRIGDLLRMQKKWH